ncbi:MAG: hypothetical protein PHC34_06560 [Candidatus Gastranaerophilales bacterium]|nr:hypothetical protein [Candidatus Gastranaerophilales bacterium]
MYRDHEEYIESLNLMDLTIKANCNIYNYSLQKKDNGNVSFKSNLGCVSGFMNLAQNNAAFSTGVVDIAGMVAPRTAIDAQRNEHAGAETFRREIMGTLVNNVAPGIFALGIAAAMKPFMKMQTTIWANSETMDLLKEAWDKSGDTKEYVKNVLSGVKGLDGDKWTDLKMSVEKQDILINKMTDLIKINRDTVSEKGIIAQLKSKIKTYNDIKKGRKEVEALIGEQIKARNNIKISLNGSTKEPLETSLEHLVRDMRDMGEHIFTKAVNKGINIDTAISRLKKVNVTKSAGTLGILCVVDFCVQYVNRKITNKKTGKKGFVGYKDFENGDCELKDSNRKRNLNIGKALGVAALVGLNAVFIGRKNLVKKLEFKNAFANLNQIRLLFSAAVAGRIVAADDSNELRETSTRDFFSYFNWLVLGGIVAKGVAGKSDSTLLNNKDEGYKDRKGLDKICHWIQDISIKSHSEVLDINSGKLNNEVKVKLGILNKSIGAGLVYSTIVLGIGIPILNILLTNKKRDEELAALKLNTAPVLVKNKYTYKEKLNNQLFAAFIK